MIILIIYLIIIFGNKLKNKEFSVNNEFIEENKGTESVVSDLKLKDDIMDNIIDISDKSIIGINTTTGKIVKIYE